jgi:Leucine-rich repeat (LRR) protein
MTSTIRICVLEYPFLMQCQIRALTLQKSSSNRTSTSVIMTLIYVKDGRMSMRELAATIDRIPEMDVLKLKRIELEGTEDDIIALSKTLQGHPNLDEIHMTNITMTDSSLNLDQVVSLVLATVTDLKVLELENVPISTSALASVGYCTYLKTVAFPNSNLTDKDASVLAKAVTQSDSIELIDLSGNDLTDLGCIAFASALVKNTSIKSIRLEGNGKISGEQRTKIETILLERAGGNAQAAKKKDRGTKNTRLG